MLIDDKKWLIKKYPGNNPIGIGVLWANYYLQHKQNEQYSVMFIYQYTATHQKLSND